MKSNIWVIRIIKNLLTIYRIKKLLFMELTWW